MEKIKKREILFYIVVYFVLLSSLTGCAALRDGSGFAGMDAYKKGDYQTARLQYEQAYEREETRYYDGKASKNPFTDKKGMAINAVAVAEIANILKDYAAAKRWALLSLEMATEEKHDLLIGHALANLSEAYVGLEEYQSAIESGMKALKLIDKNNIGYAYLSVGEAYSRSGDIDTALEYFKKASENKVKDSSDMEQRFNTELQSEFSAAEERRQPPYLIVNVSFSDQHGLSPNLVLDAGEEAELIIKVENQGNGSAFDVVPMITNEGKGFNIESPKSLGIIKAHDNKELRIPVIGMLNLEDDQASILVETREKRGYDAKKVKMSFQTAKLEKPNFIIKPDIKINDGSEGFASGNGNGKIENGETVELQVFVENNGIGDAYGVKLSLTEVTPSGVEIVRGESDIGRIGVNETAKGKVVIRVPRHIQLSTLNAKFRVEEVERKAAQAEKMVSLSGGTLKPDLMVQVNWNDGGSGLAKGNGNGIWETGETIEGVLTIHNRGSIPAEDVEVTLQASDRSRVELGQRQFQVGRLGPNQSSIPLRTTVTLPRTYDGKEVVINALVHQQDFSEVRESYRQAITIRRPELVVIQRMLNQTTGDQETIGSITQGEETKLEVRVRNEGSLEAKGVTISVGSDKPEIRVGEKKAYTIGAIPAGKTSEPIFIPLTVTRRAVAGKSAITIDVQQEDFTADKTAGVFMVREEGIEEVKVTGEAVKSVRPTISAPVVTSPPVIIRSTPPSGGETQDRFQLVWEEVREVSTVMVRVNDEAVPLQESSMQDERGIGLNVRDQKSDTKLRRVMVPLRPGENMIVVTGYDLNNHFFEDRIAVMRRSTEIGKNWALLIGINDYYNWPKLSTATNDVNGLRGVLGERYGFSPDRIKTVTNHAATREGILDAFQWLIDNTADNDNVFIYYAGHGELDKVSGYWVPVEAKRDKKSYYISNSNIRDYIGAVKAKHVYLVTDSCFSGSLFASATRSQPPVITERYYQEIYQRKSRQALTSGGTEPVSDAGYDNHSIFAYYFIKTLRENNERYMTATEIFSKIAPPVANNSKQTPIGQPIKDVQDEGGEFIFAIDGQLP